MNEEIARAVVTALAIWAGSLFVFAGTIKLGEPSSTTAKAIAAYRLTPAALSLILGRVFPPAELATGALILLTPFANVGFALGTALAGTFAIASTSVLLRGIDTACGCAGVASEKVSPGTVIRALVMLGACSAAFVMRVPIGPVGWGAFVFAIAPTIIVTIRRRSWRRRIVVRVSA